MSLDDKLTIYFLKKSTQELFKIWECYSGDEISEIIHRASHNAAYQAQNLSDEKHEFDVYLCLAQYMEMKKAAEQTDYLRKIVLDSQRILNLDVVPIKYDSTGKLSEKDLVDYHLELKKAIEEIKK